jgi:FMN reductase
MTTTATTSRHDAGPDETAGQPAGPEQTRDDRARTILIISAGVSEPSSTDILADRFARAAGVTADRAGVRVTVRRIGLRPLAQEIMQALVGGLRSERLESAVTALAHADGVVIATPIYKAGMSGLLKSFLDVLDQDLLVAKPAALLATAGTARHALAVDIELRGVLAFFRTLTVPTSVLATGGDWSDPGLGERVERAAAELIALVADDVERAMTRSTWSSYDHTFDSAAERRRDDGPDFDTDLMRLAAGGE